jgi:hypothetical protein
VGFPPLPPNSEQADSTTDPHSIYKTTLKEYFILFKKFNNANYVLKSMFSKLVQVFSSISNRMRVASYERKESGSIVSGKAYPFLGS